MSCNGACEHPGCNVRVPGVAPDARAFAVSGVPDAALHGCARPVVSGADFGGVNIVGGERAAIVGEGHVGDFGGVNIVGCAHPVPHTHDFAGMVIAGTSPVETFFSNLAAGRPLNMPAPNAMAVPYGFRCDRWRNDAESFVMPPGGQIQRYQGWFRICTPLAPPRPQARPQAPRPQARPKPAAKPAAKPMQPKRPPAKPAPAGMVCTVWRNAGTPRPGWTVEKLPGGWWRECRPAAKPMGKPIAVAPSPDVEEAKLCAMAAPEEIALTEPDTILWWLTCGERADEDIEALILAMFEAGRDGEASAILEALGASPVGRVARGVMPVAFGGRATTAPPLQRTAQRGAVRAMALPVRAHIAAVARGGTPPARAARPPATPPAPGTACLPWRQGGGPVRTGSWREDAPGFPGWWRECWSTAAPPPAAPDPWAQWAQPADPWAQAPQPSPWAAPPTWPTWPSWQAPAPIPMAPAPPSEAELCMMATPEEMAFTDPGAIVWWLTCGPRAVADVEALFFAMVSAGRDAEADAIARALSEGESFVGALPDWLRTADDVFSSVWDTVKEVVPYGGAIDTLHRARRGLMYGPDAAKPTGRTAPTAPARRGVAEAIRESQRLVRAARKGDAAATASIARAKDEASTNAEARRRWAVLVATMTDHDKRVDALTEGRAPALTASAGTSKAGTAGTSAGRGGGGGGGFLGLLGGGR